jgi:hypothetical protein
MFLKRLLAIRCAKRRGRDDNLAQGVAKRDPGIDEYAILPDHTAAFTVRVFFYILHGNLCRAPAMPMPAISIDIFLVFAQIGLGLFDLFAIFSDLSSVSLKLSFARVILAVVG